MNSTRAFHSWTVPWGLLHCSVNPDDNALHSCLLIQEQDSAVQYQQLCAQHSCCPGLPSGLQHFLGSLQCYGGQGLALIRSPGLSSHPSYKELLSAVSCSAGSGYKYVRALNCRLVFMSMSQNRMRISL